eukprot:SAG22_NODE_629_length_8389_cov_6.069723_3_plen_175_part_00
MSDYYSADQLGRSYIAKTLGALLEAEAASTSPQLRSLTHRLDGQPAATMIGLLENPDAVAAAAELRAMLLRYQDGAGIPGPLDPDGIQHLNAGGGASVLARLRAAGLPLVPLAVLSDGNCLMHAVSVAMTGSEILYNALRKAVHAELLVHTAWYRDRNIRSGFCECTSTVQQSL